MKDFTNMFYISDSWTLSATYDKYFPIYNVH